jgi:saccharopine dehydrogenase (NAD+, L-lysine-forming)
VQGTAGGQPRSYYVYNVCDHEAVPRVKSRQFLFDWCAGHGRRHDVLRRLEKPGVFNGEQFDPIRSWRIWSPGSPWVEILTRLLD